MTAYTEHDEPEAPECEWMWRDEIEGYTTSCGARIYDIQTTCRCGLRVREIEGEGVADA